MKKNILELVGNTPILLYNGLYLKLESFNPAGSIKDRIVLNIINSLEKEGKLVPGDTIIEASSGNTGIALAMIGKIKGYKVIIVMPENMSAERKKIIVSYGAELVLTQASLGMNGALLTAEKLLHKNGYKDLNQFSTKYNPETHELFTGPEIVAEFDSLDFLVCGIGTGGTITGLSNYLKNHYPNLKVIGVEPYESSIITTGEKGPHKIQGIGAGFIPKILDLKKIDTVLRVKSDDAIKKTKEMISAGLSTGISSGAALVAAEEIKKNNPNKKILVICPDNHLKYMSVLYE
ncbi:MAG: cysteine synthase family protein [Bacilli bacterium]|nr:cysteine synthase family protein [Bacilli bacterium]